MAKQKSSRFQQFLIIGLSLIAIQVALLLYFHSTSEDASVGKAIDKALVQKGFSDPRRREQARVQLTIQNFRMKNNRLPSTLQELVPEYLDKIPLDPATGQPFEYQVKGTTFSVGSGDSSSNASSCASGANCKPSTRALEAEKQKELIASLTEDPEATPFLYSPIGKRDPFLPFDFSPKVENDPNRTELEHYTLGQLTLTAVIQGFESPEALVENSAGKGFYVKLGTKIGPDHGVVQEILKDRLVIVEEKYDFTGKKESKRVEMVIRSGGGDQADKKSSKKKSPK